MKRIWTILIGMVLLTGCGCWKISCAGNPDFSLNSLLQNGANMLLIPAIDLKDGQCVRLKQGEMDAVTVFSDDPAAMAREWVKRGARRLHLVDLNGAFAAQFVLENNLT